MTPDGALVLARSMSIAVESTMEKRTATITNATPIQFGVAAIAIRTVVTDAPASNMIDAIITATSTGIGASTITTTGPSFRR